MPPASLKTCYKPNGKVVMRQIAGETILVPISGDIADMQKLYALNDVGALVWSNLNGQRSLQVVAAELTESFDVNIEEAQADTLAFITQLLDQNLASVAS